jgi:hypothetical protein
MADNAPEPPKKAQPPLPSSGTAGQPKLPTTKLPPLQAGKTGKVVVMLSSTAKLGLPKPAPPPGQSGVTKVAPPLTPPPMPPKKIMPAATPLPAEQRLSSTTFVKLPPKTSAPAFISLVPKPVVIPEKTDTAKVAPPLLPPKQPEPSKPPELPKADARKTGPIVLNTPAAAPAKGENKKTGLIKLNTPAPAAADKPAPASESIFAEIPEPAAPPVPEGWTKLHTGELPLPSGGHKDAFQSKPTSEAHKPPPLPTTPAAKTEPVLNPAPVPLQPAHPVQHAPPLVEKGHEKSHDEHAEKLPAPHLPSADDGLKMPVVGPLPAAPEMPKAPELKKDAPADSHAPPPLPAKPQDEAKDKKSAAPYMLTSTARIPIPGVGENKPALRPAVLPSRQVRSLSESPALNPPPSAESIAAKVPTPPAEKPPEITAKAGPEIKAPEAKPAPAAKLEPPAKIEPAPAAKTEPPKISPEPAKSEPVKIADKEPAKLAAVTETAAAAGAAVVAGALVEKSAEKTKKPTLPPTRAERAKKRRYRGVIAFWILFPFVVAALFFGILYFGRDTRAEGQVIPPSGMTIADEVWIVSDFSELASGVADDDAKERVPLQLSVQEAQDHVQRVQADIASREERIHLIQDDIQAAKDEIAGLVKKSQTDSQAIYDGQGKSLDDEYNSHMAALKQAIADRAASLKLQYQPDPAFPSPEVWANAYRLALYETPPGVDGVKEHQWIADQMKQWRDFEKSMDDRYSQMREQAATTKTEASPKITDLNTKIDDLNNRITGTQAEEDPLKAELKQAQGDLAAAQASDATLDDQYYGQLDALPAQNISYKIPIRPDGRFTWLPDSPFGEGETRHVYYLFARAVRADGRQYWALQTIPLEKNHTTVIIIPPGSFESTKQILRPNLSPEEIEQ